MGCGALALLGGLGAAGMGAGAVGSANVAKQRGQNMNEDVAREMARQRSYQDQASMLFKQSLAQSTPQAANQQIHQGAQQSLQANKPASQIPFGVSSVALPDNQDAQAQSRLATTLGMGQRANAAMQGYGNYSLQQGLKDQSIGNQLGVINSEAYRSLQPLPYEIQQSSQDLQKTEMYSRLLSGLGQMMLSGGMDSGGGMGGILAGLGMGQSGPTQSDAPASMYQ